MEKDKLLRMIKEVIFEKVGEFNGLNRPESITNNDELGTDMAMEVFGDEYYLRLRDMEDNLSELIQIRYLHNL